MTDPRPSDNDERHLAKPQPESADSADATDAEQSSTAGAHNGREPRGYEPV